MITKFTSIGLIILLQSLPLAFPSLAFPKQKLVVLIEITIASMQSSLIVVTTTIFVLLYIIGIIIFAGAVSWLALKVPVLSVPRSFWICLLIILR